MTKVRIDHRFRGPPDSANGGYFAGLLARELGGSDIIVTLKQPAPLGHDLRLESNGDEAFLYDGENALAEARREEISIDVPPPVDSATAKLAAERFRADRHIYPSCFVCGPERAPGDGFRIFPDEVSEGRVAADWTAPEEFADENGSLRSEFVWAALDCPGYFAVEEKAGLALLGRIAVHMNAAVPAGVPLVVSGWSMGSAGRKHRAGTAIHDSDRRLLAVAAQTWITLR